MSIVRMFVLSCVIVTLGLISTGARSQDPPIQWGEIPIADLQMKTYAPDTSAPALILADYGHSQTNDMLGVNFVRHMRIKIFSAAGYAWGNHRIELQTKDDWEQLRDVEGFTYSLRPDGSVAKTALEDNSVFQEKVDDSRTAFRFTLPALAPGCVIEFRYKVRYKSWAFMPTWYFQHTIPTLWSEYRTVFPVTLSYAKIGYWLEPLFVNDNQITTKVLGGNSYFTRGTVKCDVSRWVMRDMPALHEEPYITTMDDYTPQVRLQLAGYLSEMGLAKPVLKTWEEVIKEVLDAKSVGGRLDGTGDLKKLTQRLIAGAGTQTAKMTAIYDYVRSSILWNRRHSTAAKDLDDLLEGKTGDSGDINILLIAMLRIAGIEADPLLASTRSNGQVTDVYPLVDQFNTVVAVVNADGSGYFLDATDPLRPCDLVNPELLHVNGLLIKEGPVTWIPIESTRPYIHRSFATMHLTSDGDTHGTLTSDDADYSALLKRGSVREKKPEEAAKEIFDSERIGLKIDSVSMTGRDTSAGPFHIEAAVTGTGFAQVAGDRMYFNPVIIDRLGSNPFRLKERKFPVDMSYRREIVCVSTVYLPEGYRVQESPRFIQLGDRYIKYVRSTFVNGDSIKTATQMKINSPHFPPGEYTGLKDLYDKIVAAESEQVVLERIPQAPTSSASAVPAGKIGKGGKKK